MLSVVCWYWLIGLWETKGTGPPLACQCTDGNNGDNNTATCFVYHQATDLPSPLKFLFLTIITTRFPSQTLASWHLVDGAPSRPVLGNRQYVGASHEWIMHLIGRTGFIDWRSRRKVLCPVTTSHRGRFTSGIRRNMFKYRPAKTYRAFDLKITGNRSLTSSIGEKTYMPWLVNTRMVALFSFLVKMTIVFPPENSIPLAPHISRKRMRLDSWKQ